jgi:hypothetical protein
MVIDPSAVLTEYPEPVTVTDTPTDPELGLRTIEGVVMVKVADAVSAGTVPRSLPDTTTA